MWGVCVQNALCRGNLRKERRMSSLKRSNGWEPGHDKKHVQDKRELIGWYSPSISVHGCWLACSAILVDFKS